jgi:enoyl-CoA hydratase/carnithine racemase
MVQTDMPQQVSRMLGCGAGPEVIGRTYHPGTQMGREARCRTVYLSRLVDGRERWRSYWAPILFDAETAERYGWINRAVPQAELDAFVTRLAHNIAQLAPGIIPAAKAAIDANLGDLLDALLEQNRSLGETFSPAATELMRRALRNGAHTREGEKALETILHAS